MTQAKIRRTLRRSSCPVRFNQCPSGSALARSGRAAGVGGSSSLDVPREFPPNGAVFPLFWYDGFGCHRLARAADRAVPIELGRFLTVINSVSDVPFRPAGRPGRPPSADGRQLAAIAAEVRFRTSPDVGPDASDTLSGDGPRRLRFPPASARTSRSDLICHAGSGCSPGRVSATQPHSLNPQMWHFAQPSS